MKQKEKNIEQKPYIVVATQEISKLIEDLTNVVADDLKEIADLAQEVFIDETKNKK